MKILYCNKYNFVFSGTEAYLFELMELMRSQGHQTALFSMANDQPQGTQDERHLIPHIDFKSANKSVIEQARLAAHAIYSREARRRLRGMILEFRPDVAHVRNIYHHLSPSILWELKAQGVPVVYHLNDFKLLCPTYNLVSHGTACDRCHGGRFWRVMTEGCYRGRRGSAALLAAEAYFHKWIGTYQTCVDRFLAPSQFVRDKLVREGWDPSKIDVLFHFQQLPEEPPSAASQRGILYFGRLSREKGVEDLVRAMRHLPQIQLSIAGEGPQQAELENLTRELGLTNVKFHGHVQGKGLERLISEACFTVMPSRAYETFGKSILESYAMGRAVVASDLGSRRELVSEGKTGLLFEAGNVGELANVISFLYDHPQVAAEMGRAGRDLVRQRYAPQAHYEAMVGIYKSLIESKKQAAKPIAAAKPRQQVRVAFIGGRGVISKYSGIESYYEEVGPRLAAMGHDVTVYCRNHFTPLYAEYRGMRLVGLPSIRSKHLETLSHTLLSTAHVLFSSCDVIHYHALGPALFSFIPRLVGKKTAVTVQGLDWQRKKWGSLASTVLRLGEHAAARLPDLTMVVSRTLQSYYRDRYGAETLYVPNGTNVRERHAPRQILEWGLKPDRYILFLGRFSPEKNCHLLIEAFEKIDTEVKLVLAGGSSYSDAYAASLSAHRSERIRMLPWVSGEALEELVSNAMLFVLPSDLEGLSLALLDAMGAGVCVLTSDILENRELVEGAGFTFRRGDVVDLERMLRLLLADSRVRQEAAHAGQERVRAQYLWPQIAGEIERAYLRLMGWENKALSASSCRSTESPGVVNRAQSEIKS